MATPYSKVVLEIVGEGKTDLGCCKPPSPPNKGVVPILVHRSCGKPQGMLVKRRPYSSLQGKGSREKGPVLQTAGAYNKSDGSVFVIDSEGDLTGRKKRIGGRDAIASLP